MGFYFFEFEENHISSKSLYLMSELILIIITLIIEYLDFDYKNINKLEFR